MFMTFPFIFHDHKRKKGIDIFQIHENYILSPQMQVCRYLLNISVFLFQDIAIFLYNLKFNDLFIAKQPEVVF